MQKTISTLDFFDTELKGTIFMTRLTKYEKETIFRTSKGDKEYSIYTFDPVLQRKLDRFSKNIWNFVRLLTRRKKVVKAMILRRLE